MLLKVFSLMSNYSPNLTFPPLTGPFIMWPFFLEGEPPVLYFWLFFEIVSLWNFPPPTGTTFSQTSPRICYPQKSLKCQLYKKNARKQTSRMIWSPHLLHTPKTYYVSTPSVPCVGGVTSTVKQTVKQIVPIDMNTEIPKLLLLLYFSR